METHYIPYSGPKDLTGMQFGELTVLGYVGDKYWECRCSCGKIKTVRTYHLVHGGTTSCGHKKREKLEGQQIYEWTVLKYIGDRKYLCRCSCGVEKEVEAYSLKSGKSKSCGHDTGALKDEVGNVYGDLTVVSYAGDKYWNCKCSCGKDVVVLGKYLRSGKTKSCGHWKLDDLTGQQFGSWTVIKYAGDLRWLCRCTCGAEREVLAQALKSGRSRSCGCGGTNVRVNYRERMLEKYGDISARRIGNPRERWQIDVLSSCDNFKEYILKYTSEFNAKPTITKLGTLLNTSFPIIARTVHKFGLDDYVEMYGNCSEKENELFEFIKSIYNGDVKHRVRNVIYPQELDIYIPDLKLAIEFNGDYWHSELRHEKNYHINKTIACNNVGVRLIHIFEYEWDNNRDKIKQYLSDIILSKKVIYARDTIVKEINNSDASEFLNNNHLQGSISSSINIGLYHNDELIGLMTFGSPRFNANYQWELLRFCWKSGLTVIGGAEKLFKYFIAEYKPESIITYSNIAKFDGSIYTKIGFKLDHMSDPGYVWISTDGKMIPRYRTTKQELVKNGLGTEDESESDIMYMLGYYRLYDCGNRVFIWEKQEVHK
ncbi:MAG: hypothetical protein IJ593_10480 [Lachnospiraceae bacterium]|nr:hypothetical protein [Lachnospiraceae bacterium]